MVIHRITHHDVLRGSQNFSRQSCLMGEDAARSILNNAGPTVSATAVAQLDGIDCLNMDIAVDNDSCNKKKSPRTEDSDSSGSGSDDDSGSGSSSGSGSEDDSDEEPKAPTIVVHASPTKSEVRSKRTRHTGKGPSKDVFSPLQDGPSTKRARNSNTIDDQYDGKSLDVPKNPMEFIVARRRYEAVISTTIAGFVVEGMIKPELSDGANVDTCSRGAAKLRSDGTYQRLRHHRMLGFNTLG